MAEQQRPHQPALPEFVGWPTFPLEGNFRVKRIDPPVPQEPARLGEGGANCAKCAAPDPEYIWVDDRWRVRALGRPSGLPAVVVLETRHHYDMGDLSNLLAAELGVLTVRLERAIRSIDGVARVHVNRWGDGSEHLHVFFLARPEGMLQLRGTFLSMWDDILPPIPEAQWRDNLAFIAAWLAEYGGQAVAAPTPMKWEAAGRPSLDDEYGRTALDDGSGVFFEPRRWGHADPAPGGVPRTGHGSGNGVAGTGSYAPASHSSTSGDRPPAVSGRRPHGELGTARSVFDMASPPPGSRVDRLAGDGGPPVSADRNVSYGATPPPHDAVQSPAGGVYGPSSGPERDAPPYHPPTTATYGTPRAGGGDLPSSPLPKVPGERPPRAKGVATVRPRTPTMPGSSEPAQDTDSPVPRLGKGSGTQRPSTAS